jgi:hypothetical protein
MAEPDGHSDCRESGRYGIFPREAEIREKPCRKRDADKRDEEGKCRRARRGCEEGIERDGEKEEERHRSRPSGGEAGADEERQGDRDDELRRQETPLAGQHERCGEGYRKGRDGETFDRRRHHAADQVGRQCGEGDERRDGACDEEALVSAAFGRVVPHGAMHKAMQPVIDPIHRAKDPQENVRRRTSPEGPFAFRPDPRRRRLSEP